MQTARHHSAGDIVRHKSAPLHIGRVSAVLGDRLRVRWGQTRWIGEADAGDVETIVTERTLFARLHVMHATPAHPVAAFDGKPYDSRPMPAGC